MNILLYKLDPIITRQRFQKAIQENRSMSCSYCIYMWNNYLSSIVLGITARFLSTFVSMMFPAYKSIKSQDKSDDRQWLQYWILNPQLIQQQSLF
ncbi:unnamed protein product [Paramecium sonneborni]|uniref:Uncharacterized protein n=1 Tax=Paramecium sonneborni TaxID=65129 RepID=A0A8S1RLQ3_9CILI|nr:unnamed protein product [Paramecium sonneborni]